MNRTYDSSAGNWTAPDAYAGEVHDPMSQKSYIWNDNNPVAYADPSGYESGCVSLNENCISPAAANQIGKIGASIFNITIGNDINTLRNPNASATTKLFAVLSIASIVGGIEIKGLEALGIKSIQVVEHGISKLGNDAGHNFPAFFDKDIINNGETIIGEDGYITRRLNGALNGHRGWYEIGGKVDNGVWQIDHRSFTELDRVQRLKKQ